MARGLLLQFMLLLFQTPTMPFARFLKLLFGALIKIPPSPTTAFRATKKAFWEFSPRIAIGHTIAWWTIADAVNFSIITGPQFAMSKKTHTRYIIKTESARNIDRYSARFSEDSNAATERVLVPGTSFIIEDITEDDDGFTEIYIAENGSFSSLSFGLECAARVPVPDPPSRFREPDADSPLQSISSHPPPTVLISNMLCDDGNVVKRRLSPVSSVKACVQYIGALMGVSDPSQHFDIDSADKDDTDLLKVTMESIERDINSLSLFRLQESSSSDAAPPAIRRVVIKAPGLSPVSDDLLHQENVTLVELPTPVTSSLFNDEGETATDTLSQWLTLSRASLDLLAVCPGTGSRDLKQTTESFIAQIATEAGMTNADDMKQVVLNTTCQSAVAVSGLPSLPELQPVDTVTRTAGIVPGTRVVSNVRHAASCATLKLTPAPV